MAKPHLDDEFIHESLKNSDFSSIGFSDYLERLTQNLIHSYSNLTTGVELITSSMTSTST